MNKELKATLGFIGILLAAGLISAGLTEIYQFNVAQGSARALDLIWQVVLFGFVTSAMIFAVPKDQLTKNQQKRIFVAGNLPIIGTSIFLVGFFLLAQSFKHNWDFLEKITPYITNAGVVFICSGIAWMTAESFLILYSFLGTLFESEKK
jgi:hypothetical protein